jgi:hypothetical protein
MFQIYHYVYILDNAYFWGEMQENGRMTRQYNRFKLNLMLQILHYKLVHYTTYKLNFKFRDLT